MTYRDIRVSLPIDGEGMVGRECPALECGRYFKLRPGTGMDTTVCHCPYCGQSGESQDFATDDQIEYAKSVAYQEILEPSLLELEQTFKDLERQTAGGLISFKVDVRREPSYLHQYHEMELETRVICDNCALEFSVFGVFASCPDCQRLNALTTCLASLDVARKRVRLAEDSSVDADLRRQFPRDALRDAVSALDSYGKALRAKYPDRIRSRAKTNLFQDADALDVELRTAALPAIDSILLPDEARVLRWLLQARHVYEHNAGVVDDRFVDRVPEAAHIHGRLLPLPGDDLLGGVDAVAKLAQGLDESFAAPRP